MIDVQKSSFKKQCSFLVAVVIVFSLVAPLHVSAALNYVQPTSKLVPAGIDPNDRFGSSIDGSGERFITLAPGDTTGHPTTHHRGTVYIYSKDQNGSWSYTSPTLSGLPVSPANTTSYSLYDVAIDGDTAVVGDRDDYYEDVNGPNFTGAVYVLRHDTETEQWVDTKIKPSDGGYSYNFGQSVDIDDDRIIVGAPGKDDTDISNGWGGAYIYQFDALSGTWLESILPAPSGYGPSRSFGHQVAISGDTAYISDLSGNQHGAVYIYEKQQSGDWIQAERIVPSDAQYPGTSDGRHFGYSISVDDNVLAVGAFGDNSTQATIPMGMGAVYMYERGSNGELQETKLLPPEPAIADPQASIKYGVAVLVKDGRLYVGASDAPASHADGGAVYEYSQGSDGQWDYVTKYGADRSSTSGEDGIAFGAGLAITETDKVFSALSDSLQRGAVYVFGPDSTPPTVTGQASFPSNSNGWYKSDVPINWTAVDSSGTATTPPQTLAQTEGANVPYTSSSSCDAFNNCSTGTLSLSIDKTAPTLGTPTWTNNPLLEEQDTTLSIAATDVLSGVQKVQYSIDGGSPQQLSYDSAANLWKATLGSALEVDTYTFEITAFDNAGNASASKSDVLAVYNAANGYVTGHIKTIPTAGDELPIDLDTNTGNNSTKLVLGLTNVKAATSTTPTSGSFDLNYIVKNNQDEFSLSSTVIDWLVVPDSTHASILGRANLTTIINGESSVTNNVTVSIDLVLGADGEPDHVTVKIYAPGASPNTDPYSWLIDDDSLENQSNIMIKP